MDSWTRQEEIWRQDIDEQLSAFSRRLKYDTSYRRWSDLFYSIFLFTVRSTERMSKETKDNVTEVTERAAILDEVVAKTSTMSNSWQNKTDQVVIYAICFC